MKAFTLSLLTLALNALSVSASSQQAQSNEYQNSVRQFDNQIDGSGNEGIAFNQNENTNNSNGDWIQNLGDLTYAENNSEYSNESCDGALGNELAAGKRRGSRRPEEDACKKCSRCLRSKRARVNKLFSDPVFDELKKAFANLKSTGTLKSYRKLRKAIKESTPPAAAPAAASAAAPKPTAGGK
ncbi:hypothetical protein AX774_g7912 [Zancudomyces culisetae]|uniref:Uncharacterized protein n=1 Tax=Zancudomyces culisetae TaxID=1213189 RepID=A0A1R1PCV8_ZANCU|nr:hypothetical protein AX774_g7912 [Zancudomyces culisetae]|eukprot:OMH78692.1 hypothetical protein AX774_g7912 [Zancudomyces culisetae]